MIKNNHLNIYVTLAHTIKKYNEGVIPMMVFSLWKNLKKRLRRNRRPTWSLGAIWFSLLLGGLAAINAGHVLAAPALDEQQSSVIKALEQQQQPLTVQLRRVYLCGEESKPLGRMMNKQVLQLLHGYSDWKADLNEQQGTVNVELHIEDLSEHCKANAYMSVDKKGNLALFDGVPKKEKVVRTFFQLDIHYMESSLPQNKLDELSKGIRISDIDEYNSVLSTFSDYAAQPNQRVMRPTY